MAESDHTQQTRPEQSTTRTGHLSIQKIYVKDLSFEAPHAPQIFRDEWKPTVDIHLANSATSVAENVHEVVLTVTITVRFGDKTAYLVEVQQAGLFNVTGFPEQHLAAMLATVCPNILFPFARETVSDVVSRGGFPQMLLAPVNFEQLYAQEVQRRREARDAGAKTH
jgi:preprotein translocase subunit SecB